jgi:hypothetical protein
MMRTACRVEGASELCKTELASRYNSSLHVRKYNAVSRSSEEYYLAKYRIRRSPAVTPRIVHIVGTACWRLTKVGNVERQLLFISESHLNKPADRSGLQSPCLILSSSLVLIIWQTRSLSARKCS